MKKTVLASLFVLSMFTSRAQTFNPLLATMLQDTLDTYVGMISNIKGMSAAVYVPGQGTWTGAAGVSYTGQPVTTDMRFGIASNTKLFVATSMMILVEDGIITLNDPISLWLPNYNNVNPNITIRQLLNHTSGLSDPIFVSPWMDTINANPTRVFTPNEVLSWQGAPVSAPGVGYNYSNINYILCGMIAESATGNHISEIIRDSILTPLSMDSTFYDVEETEIGTIAHRWWNTIDYHDTSRVGLNSAGGCAGSLFSTGAEMVHWYHRLFEGAIINQSSLDEITTFLDTPSPVSDYGMGLQRETTSGRTYWGHGGSTWGYRSKMIYDSCTTVSVGGFSNSFPSGQDAVTFLLYRCVMNHIPGGCASPINGSTTVCQNTTGVTYSVAAIPGATSYQWELPNGATGFSATSSITVNFGAAATSGYVIVRGVNQYGPGGFSQMWVTVNPTPPTPTISQNGNQLTSTAPIGNQWYNSAGVLVNDTNVIYNVTVTDDYYTIVTLNGCSSDTSNMIHVIPTGVAEHSFLTSSIYPNPAGDVLNIVLSSGISSVQVEITNALGQPVYSAPLSGSAAVSLAELNPGMYFIRIYNENYSENHRILHE